MTKYNLTIRVCDVYFDVVVRLGDAKYSGEIPQLNGCNAEGMTLTQCQENLETAAKKWLTEWAAKHDLCPKTKKAKPVAGPYQRGR